MEFASNADRHRAFSGKASSPVFASTDLFARWKLVPGYASSRLLYVDPDAKEVASAALIRFEPELAPDGTLVTDLYAAYPIVLRGTPVTITAAAPVYGGRHVEEAGISCTLACEDENPWLPFCFFDTHHVVSDPRPGPLRAQIACVALAARRPHTMFVDVARCDPSRSLVDARGSSRGDLVRDGAFGTAWLPRMGCADLVEFRGQVRNIRRVDPIWPGEPGWRADLRVGRSPAGRALVFDFVVTATTLAGEPPPDVGETIEGLAWVQGRLI